jgi:hypothetical protein
MAQAAAQAAATPVCDEADGHLDPATESPNSTGTTDLSVI